MMLHVVNRGKICKSPIQKVTDKFFQKLLFQEPKILSDPYKQSKKPIGLWKKSRIQEVTVGPKNSNGFVFETEN